jgi:uncharacterized Zn finger protein
MSSKKTPKKAVDQWIELAGADIDDWTGERIADRGRAYQRAGHVQELGQLADGSLIAWVEGTERYATHVFFEDDGFPASFCTCPYEEECKHAVATVIEYQKRLQKHQHIPRAGTDDIRLRLLEEDEEPDSEDVQEGDAFIMADDTRKDIERFLKGRTKAQLVDLVIELCTQFPQVAKAIIDRRQLASGNIRLLVERLRKEIRSMADRPGWQNYWNNEGFTPDFSGIRRKLVTLLEAGHADAALSLGRDLVAAGTELIESSDDEGETAEEVTRCMSLMTEALEKSSLQDADKLDWAIATMREDNYGICEPLMAFLDRRHSRSAWSTVADRLLKTLKTFKPPRGADTFTRHFERNRLSDWIIHALENAGRHEEIVPLCEVEARRTGSYERLVDRLIQGKRYQDAEAWIAEGLEATDETRQGTAIGLRNRLLEIRRRERDWPAVAAMQVEDFVRRPALQGFTECRKSSEKAKVWPEVRQSLLDYLETGRMPWLREDWPLQETGIEKPKSAPRRQFPMLGDLIDVGIEEENPEAVLKWYDRRSEKAHFRYGIDDNAVAEAVQTHAPARSVAIWQALAERQIAMVKPRAYQTAAGYLRKAERVIKRSKRDAEWRQYLQTIRQQHFRKRRLIEILEEFD